MTPFPDRITTKHYVTVENNGKSFDIRRNSDKKILAKNLSYKQAKIKSREIAFFEAKRNHYPEMPWAIEPLTVFESWILILIHKKKSTLNKIVAFTDAKQGSNTVRALRKLLELNYIQNDGLKITLTSEGLVKIKNRRKT